MRYAKVDECRAAGICSQDVERIAMKLSRAAKEARALGLTIFGGAGTGTLRIHDDPGNVNGTALIVADLEGIFDGGDGACSPDDDGLMRAITYYANQN